MASAVGISRRELAGLALGAAALPPTAQAAEGRCLWRNVTVGGGGFMPGIVFSRAEQGLAYLRSDMGGAYRWDVGAGRWIPLQDGLAEGNYQGIESLAADPVDPERVYLAAGTYRSGPAAILRSADRGASWAIAPVPFRMGGNEDGRGVGERLAIDPNLTSTLYFGSRHDGLQRSLDRGATWEKVASFPVAGLGLPPERGPTHTGLPFVVFDPASGRPGSASRTLIVASADPASAGLYRSDDAGLSWRRIEGGPMGRLLPLKADVDAAGVLYVTYGDRAGPNGVTDGAVWRYALADGTWADITPDTRPDRPKGGYMGVAIDRQRSGRLLVSTLNRYDGGDTLWRSTDGGSTWTSLKDRSRQDVTNTPWLEWGQDEASFGWWMAGLAIDPFDGRRAVYTTGATVYATQDLDAPQLTWSPWVAGVEQTAVLNLASPPQGAHLLSGFGDIGGFVHDDFARPPAAMFVHPAFDNTNNLDFAELKPQVVVRSGSHHSGRGDTLALSEDGGRSWRPLTAPPAADPPPLPSEGSRRGDPVKDAALLVSADGASLMLMQPAPMISQDGGASWRPVRGLPTYVRPVADRADGRRWHAIDFATGRRFASTDGGETFAPAPTRGLPADITADRPTWREDPFPLIATPGLAGDLWFVSRSGLFHSANGGAVFAPIAGEVRVERLALGRPAPGRGYPALFAIGWRETLRAIWRSDDIGRSWIRLNDEAHEWGRRFRCVAADPRVFGRVYVGTDGRGILYGEVKR